MLNGSPLITQDNIYNAIGKLSKAIYEVQDKDRPCKQPMQVAYEDVYKRMSSRSPATNDREFLGIVTYVYMLHRVRKQAAAFIIEDTQDDSTLGFWSRLFCKTD